MSNTRIYIYKLLMKTEREGAFSNLVFDAALSKQTQYDDRDRAFISTIFYGVLERRISLDYIIRKHSSIRLKKIQPEVLTILRIAAYQLVFMDKVPDNAAVNEAVSMCKKLGYSRSAGFVNAVLRSITRENERFPLPDKNDLIKYFSVKYSCPENIISLWAEQYGLDIAQKMLEQLIGKPPMYVFVNTLKITTEKLIEKFEKEGIRAERTCIPDSLRVYSNGSIIGNIMWRDGLFHVQDLSSQICCYLINVKNGDVVSDVCAAPGGKTLNLSRSIGNGKIYAYDQYKFKTDIIENNAKRLGVIGVTSAQRDAMSYAAPLEMSDKILCDVPCSGLGVLRRKPEIRYKEDTGVNALPEIQMSILENSSRFVKPNGILVYSTCTLNKKENNENAALFLERHNEFEAIPITIPKGIKRTIDEEENCLTLFPQTNNTDGFFIAMFRKK